MGANCLLYVFMSADTISEVAIYSDSILRQFSYVSRIKYTSSTLRADKLDIDYYPFKVAEMCSSCYIAVL